MLSVNDVVLVSDAIQTAFEEVKMGYADPLNCDYDDKNQMKEVDAIIEALNNAEDAVDRALANLIKQMREM